MSEGYEIFEAWVQKFQAAIDGGEEVKVPIKSLETFAKMSVRAKINKTEEGLTDPIHLRVVNDLGEKRAPMFIQVLEEVDLSEVGSVETG